MFNQMLNSNSNKKTPIKLDYDYLFKFIVIGDSYTGKSSIVSRFADDDFVESYISTIGIDFKIRIIEHNNKIIKLQIWDCAGQERYRSIVSSYYRGANGVIITYSISNRESFENVKYWYEDCKRYCKSNVNIILVGTKTDLDKKREVLFSEGQELADSLNLFFIETSAKYDVSVNKAFVNLADQTMQSLKSAQTEQLKQLKQLQLNKSNQFDQFNQFYRFDQIDQIDQSNQCKSNISIQNNKKSNNTTCCSI